MEKKGLLGVRKSPPLTKSCGGGGGGSLARAIAAYLASDSFMYAPLVFNSQTTTTTPVAAPSSLPAGAGSSEALGVVPLLHSRRICGQVGVVPGVVAFYHRSGDLAFIVKKSEHKRRFKGLRARGKTKPPSQLNEGIWVGLEFGRTEVKIFKETAKGYNSSSMICAWLGCAFKRLRGFMSPTWRCSYRSFSGQSQTPHLLQHQTKLKTAFKCWVSFVFIS